MRRAVVLLAVGLSAAGCSAFSSGGTGDTISSTRASTIPPATTAPPASTSTRVTTTTTAAATSTTRDETHFSPEELEYFAVIAGDREYGPTDGLIHKWAKDLRLVVYGEATAGDLAALDAVVADLNRLVAPIRLLVVESDPNVEIHFAPTWEFASIEPHYVAGNTGFFMAWSDSAENVKRARVLIASESTVSALSRAHLIREELTQILYLPNDTLDYADSIFYKDWTTVTAFAPIDEALIEMLYRPEIISGMTVDEAVAILAEVVRE